MSDSILEEEMTVTDPIPEDSSEVKDAFQIVDIDSSGKDSLIIF